MPTFTYPLLDDTSLDNAPYEASHGSDKIPPQYISVAVLFGSFFILALLVVIVYVGLFPISTFKHSHTTSDSGFRRTATSPHPDTERAHPIAYLGTFQDPDRTRALLDAVSPATSFKNVGENKKKTTTTPPYQSGTTIICVICLDDFKPKSEVRRLPCGHIFHATCIEEWLLKKHHFNCPLCNKCYLPDMPTVPRPVLAPTGTGRDREDSQFVYIPL